MKLNKSKLALTLLIASATTMSFVSHAEEEFSQPTTKLVDLTFKAPTTKTYTTVEMAPSIPKAGVLTADETPLAKATGTSMVGDYRMGMRFTPNSAIQKNINKDKAVLIGKNNPANTISIKMLDVPGDWVWKVNSAGTYLTIPVAAPEQVINIGLDSEQTLSADTYTVSLDSSQFNN